MTFIWNFLGGEQWTPNIGWNAINVNVVHQLILCFNENWKKASNKRWWVHRQMVTFTSKFKNDANAIINISKHFSAVNSFKLSVESSTNRIQDTSRHAFTKRTPNIRLSQQQEMLNAFMWLMFGDANEVFQSSSWKTFSTNALIIFRTNFFAFCYGFIYICLYGLHWVSFVLSSLIILIISVDLIFLFAWTKLLNAHWIWFALFILII